jgi:hypothetical protein
MESSMVPFVAKYARPSQSGTTNLSNSKQWDAMKISTLFGQQAATVILLVPIITAQGQDMLCWTPTSSGICTSKSAYKQLAVQQRGATIPTHTPRQVLELLPPSRKR